jgi:hypothetical protein
MLNREQKAEARQRQQQLRHRPDRNRAPQSEQPQIERQHRSHQHNEAEDVQDLDRGIKRGRAAHQMTQRAFLQGQEDRRGQLVFHSGLPQFDALAVENDIFDPRLVRIAGMRIAEYGAGLARRDHVRRAAAQLHARRRRQHQAPVVCTENRIRVDGATESAKLAR